MQISRPALVGCDQYASLRLLHFAAALGISPELSCSRRGGAFVHEGTRPVGGVLCTRRSGPTAIHLGLPSLTASCGLPASIGRAGHPHTLAQSPRPEERGSLLTLLRGEVYLATAVTCDADGLPPTSNHLLTWTKAWSCGTRAAGLEVLLPQGRPGPPSYPPGGRQGAHAPSRDSSVSQATALGAGREVARGDLQAGFQGERGQLSLPGAGPGAVRAA
jgi:hypothetical protein